MTGRHVLFVGGPGHEVPKARRLGLRYSMIQIPERDNADHRAGAENYAVLDYRKSEEILPVVREWHAADPFDAVLSFTEYGLEPASRCAHELGVAGDNLQAVLATRDKTRTRELLDRHGLSPVRHRVCADPAEAGAFMAALGGGPIVLKPTAGGLSEGVYLVTEDSQIAERWTWTTRWTDGPVLAEEYLDGPEYSVESLSRDGKHEIVMVTEKLTTGAPGFVELGHQQPARLAPEVREAIDALVLRFLDLIGQRTGPVHTELRVTAAGPRLIEAQTRAGGDQIWELTELVTGVDVISETFAGLLDLPAPARTPRAQGAAIRFLAFEHTTVGEVHGLEDARRAPGLVRMVSTLTPGRVLTDLASSDGRQGYVICQGESTADAVAKAEAARDLVRLEPAAQQAV
ncbi:ATP-grasp domain-containing protein [Streptomyces sp. NPDC056361]|uniref:ATP-grasp domain-containing protein n=1 Tax=Streptomyces sp. NPDC056361 TaxID=3345795 RepID=UPI0035E022EF